MFVGKIVCVHADDSIVDNSDNIDFSTFDLL